MSVRDFYAADKRRIIAHVLALGGTYWAFFAWISVYGFFKLPFDALFGPEIDIYLPLSEWIVIWAWSFLTGPLGYAIWVFWIVQFKLDQTGRLCRIGWIVSLVGNAIHLFLIADPSMGFGSIIFLWWMFASVLSLLALFLGRHKKSAPSVAVA